MKSFPQSADPLDGHAGLSRLWAGPRWARTEFAGPSRLSLCCSARSCVHARQATVQTKSAGDDSRPRPPRPMPGHQRRSRLPVNRTVGRVRLPGLRRGRRRDLKPPAPAATFEVTASRGEHTAPFRR